MTLLLASPDDRPSSVPGCWRSYSRPSAARPSTHEVSSRCNSAGNGLGTMLILPARQQPHRQGSQLNWGQSHHLFGGYRVLQARGLSSSKTS
jgi:hypothetical protein